LARLQAKQDVPITNLLHGRVEVDALSRCLLPLLDGDRNLDALVSALKADPVARAALASGQQPEATSASLQSALRHEVSKRLAQLARAALLLD
jgi:hypothetical protein